MTKKELPVYLGNSFLVMSFFIFKYSIKQTILKIKKSNTTIITGINNLVLA